MHKETNEKLGAYIEDGKTIFRIYAPISKTAYLMIYRDQIEAIKMKKNENCFEIEFGEIMQNLEYNYLIDYEIYIDPYSKKLTKDKKRSIALPDIFVKGFNEHIIPNLDYKDAIIYETHIRDFTGDDNIEFKNREKFLGMVEEKDEDIKVGFSHLKELGINYVHLLPVQSIRSITEDEYNWGYDPEFYFSLENSYSDEKDFKKMIMKFHENGIGVIMDVVFNHTYFTRESVYERLVPNYYYRMNGESFSNGSGVGNELDTSKPMVKKLIIDCLKYFVEEYKIDGFRFDLMGLMDKETSFFIVDELRKINPNILIYGEPWIGFESVLDENKRTLKGIQKDKKFSLFNDIFRDAIRGENDNGNKGYINNNIYKRHDILTGIVGSIYYNEDINGFTSNPYESINYISCHDNLILLDKIKKTGVYEEDLKRHVFFSFSLQLLSFGNQFIHAGTEFMMSKNMNSNTYNNKELNIIRWDKKRENLDLSNFVRDLISLRKKLKLASFSADDIRKKLKFSINHRKIAYKIDIDEGVYSKVYIIHNPTEEEKEIPFKDGDLIKILYNNKFINENYKNEKIPAKSSMVLVKRRK